MPVLSQKYLGVHISSDGKNKVTISDKCNKAIGVIKQIFNKLEGMKLGKYYFSTAIFLRQSVLMSSLLYGTEVLYNMDEADVRRIESMDEDYLRKMYNVERSAPIALLYLEAGVYPARFLIKIRKFRFLKYILDQKSTSLIKQIYIAQKAESRKGDWSLSVRKDLEECEIDLPDAEIRSMSKKQFMILAKEKVQKSALIYLNLKKEKLRKSGQLKYTSLKIAEYLTNIKIDNQTKKDIFKMRTRMSLIAAHFPGRFGSSMCQLGCNIKEDYQHLINCPSQKVIKSLQFNFEDIDGNDSHILKETIIKINKIINIRNRTLELINT